MKFKMAIMQRKTSEKFKFYFHMPYNLWKFQFFELKNKQDLQMWKSFIE